MKRASLLFLSLFAFLLLPVEVFGQAQTGTPPFGSFGGGPDVIDLANLNSHIVIPVIHKPGRGQNLAFDITYDSAVWYPVGASGSQSWTHVTNWGWQGAGGIVSPYVGMSKIPNRICFDNGILGGQTGEEDTYYWSFTNQAAVSTFFGTTTAGWGQCGGQPVPPPTTLNATATNGTGYSFSATGGGYASLYDSKGQAIYAPVNTQTPLTGPMTTDRNGNEISYNNGIVDTLGVTMLTESGVAPNPVVFSYPAPGGTAKVTVNYTSYTVATNFGASGIKEFGATAVSLVSSIVLPDGTQYTFNYEPTPSVPSTGACTPKSGTFSSYCVTGRIASMQLPTGGSIQYTYSGGNNGVLSDGTVATLRHQTPDGTWTYTRSLGTSPASTDIVTDPAGNDTVIQFQSVYETQRQVYSGSHTSGTLLRTTNTCYNGSTAPCTGTAVSLPITMTVATIQDNPSGLECKHVTTWNNFGMMTEQDDYDYGNNTPGSLLRQTFISYAAFGNNINAFPQSVTIKDGAGHVASQISYNYDETAVVASSSTPQHISVSGSRGNLTSAVYTTQGASTLKQSFSYYDTGTIKTATDVNNATTTYNFPDATSTCGNAFPTSVSEPLGLSRSTTWNCTGGVEASATDENGKTVSTAWTDADFWRPASTTDQAGNHTNFSYGLNPPTAESSMAFNGTGSIVDIVKTFDALGRVKTTQQREAPSSTNFDSVETDYDSFGRSSRVTVPYVGVASGTNGSAPATTQTYDAPSRPLVTTDGGGGTVTLSYSANDVLQTIGPAPTGENPKRKQSEYNSIGELTSVCEITGASGSGTCGQTTPATGYWTKYTYDAAGRLLTVTQNAQSAQPQTRTFTYDDLGRMTSEANPESGTTTYVYDSDSSMCGNGAYTSGGDLVKMTDASGDCVMRYYDALHRVTDIGNNHQSLSHCKRFRYDNSSGYPGSTKPSGLTNTLGRLIEAATDECVSGNDAIITDEWFSYTARGEVSDDYESTPHSGGYYHATATYWANGVLSTLNATNGYATNYNVDGEGRIYSAGPGGNQLASTVYNSASEPTIVTFASLDNDSFTYDPNTFHMTQYKFTVGATPKSVVGNVTWNANGTLNKLAITDPFNAANTQTCNYSYDDLARIASGNCGSVWSQTFSYDAFGNITKAGSEQFQPGYNLNNQMTNGASYDASGDVLNDGLHSYAWDTYGRPTTIDTVAVIYDALGRMVEQGKSGANTELQYSPTGFVMQLMNGQAWVKEFVPMPGGTKEVWQANGASPYYRHADWLGSSRFASTYSTRAMYNDLAYAPFGEQYAQTGSTGITDTSFAGNDEDTTTNLYDAQAREYGIQGRWPSPDPAGLKAVNPSDPQTWNRYAYVRNNPLLLTDVSGMRQCNTVEAMPGDTSQQASGYGPYDPEEAYAPVEGAGGGVVCGGFDSPFGGGSGDDQIGIDGGFGPASLAGGGMGAMGNGFGGSAADVQCPNNVCSGVNDSGEFVQFEAFADGSSGYIPWNAPEGFSMQDFVNAQSIVSAAAGGTLFDPNKLTGQAKQAYQLLLALGVSPGNILIYQTGTQSFAAVLTDAGFNELEQSPVFASNFGDAFLHYPYTEGGRSDQTPSLHGVWFDESLTDYMGGSGVYMQFHQDSSNPWNGGFWQHWGCDVFHITCH